jgi:hypothetical protein
MSTHLQLLAPTNLHWAHVVDYGLFCLCVIHKEGLYPSGDINRLMVMIMISDVVLMPTVCPKTTITNHTIF